MGRYDLRLGEDEFWSLTFREFAGLLRRHRRERDQLDFRSGIIASSVLNSVPRGADAHLWTPGDFFPGLRRPEPPEKTAYTEEEVDAFWDRAVGVFQRFAPSGPPVPARVG